MAFASVSQSVVPAQVPAVSTWSDVQRVAQAATNTIQIPPPETQIKPVDMPMSDAIGLTEALTTGLPPVAAAVKAVPEAFTQAAGGPVAQTPLGSLLGVGLGGTTPGTGPLPGALGVAAQQIFGENGVPIPARFPTVRVILEMHPSFKRALEGAGTSCATRLWGIKPRLLGDFRGAFLDLAMMRHEDQFRASLLTLLRELINSISMGLGAPMPPLGASLIQTPVVRPMVPVAAPSFAAVTSAPATQAPSAATLASIISQNLPFSGSVSQTPTPNLFSASDSIVSALNKTQSSGQPASVPTIPKPATVVAATPVRSTSSAPAPVVVPAGLSSIPQTVTQPGLSSVPQYVIPVGSSSSPSPSAGAPIVEALAGLSGRVAKRRRWRA